MRRLNSKELCDSVLHDSREKLLCIKSIAAKPIMNPYGPIHPQFDF